MAETCDYCGGVFSRPGLFDCNSPQHPQPDAAQRIARVIEDDIRDRRGLRQEWEAIDDEIQQEIRDSWAYLIGKQLEDIKGGG